jgi:hypothetical protein
VIDTRSDEVFVAAEESARVSGKTVVEHVLAALALSSGKLGWKRVVDPPGNGRLYHVAAEQQRGALTLANGRVYVPLGGLYGDCGTYHGYMVALPDTGNGALESYQVPTHDAGAIWETDGAVVSAAGDLYVATGNSFDGPGKPFDFGDAVIELSPALRELGYFAPADWAQLNGGDLDLGSAGPIEVPGTKLLFEEGKANEKGVGVGYLLEEGRLGGIAHPVFAGTACPNGGYVFGADAAAVVGGRTYVYVACSGGTVAIAVTAGAHPSFRQSWSPSSCDPNGPPIVAGGLVWAIGTGADGGGAANQLCGMKPTSGKVVVTQSLDGVEHFVTPAVADGMMLVPTTGGVEAFRAR